MVWLNHVRFAKKNKKNAPHIQLLKKYKLATKRISLTSPPPRIIIISNKTRRNKKKKILFFCADVPSLFTV